MEASFGIDVGGRRGRARPAGMVQGRTMVGQRRSSGVSAPFTPANADLIVRKHLQGAPCRCGCVRNPAGKTHCRRSATGGCLKLEPLTCLSSALSRGTSHPGVSS
ncbi:MAG: hypothetical protein EOO78_07905 [Oxalobacteraceae bacterium]|nr:MAG: hypothetical protein EOO78_07905 [Oxalobacteraceae bacterium]